MKPIQKSLPLFFFIYCSNRNDIIFSASDELHFINLYQQNDEFNMPYNGLSTVEGHYEQQNDTISLTYLPDEYLDFDIEGKRHANEVLTRIIVLDRKSQRIHSVNGQQFCADVNINLLDK